MNVLQQGVLTCIPAGALATFCIHNAIYRRANVATHRSLPQTVRCSPNLPTLSGTVVCFSGSTPMVQAGQGIQWFTVQPAEPEVPGLEMADQDTAVYTAVQKIKSIIKEAVGVDALKSFHMDRTIYKEENGDSLDFIVIVARLVGVSAEGRNRLHARIMEFLADSSDESVQERVTVSLR